MSAIEEEPAPEAGTSRLPSWWRWPRSAPQVAKAVGLLLVLSNIAFLVLHA
jgi:hypothetical protein